MTGPSISQHADGTVPDLVSLARTAEAEGHGFVQRTIDEWQSGRNRFDAANEAFFVAKLEHAIVGMCGVNIDPYANDPRIARLRHLYVHPEHRSDGIGAALVDRCVSHASTRFRQLQLRTPTEAADQFYDRLGFERLSSDSATHVVEF